jgi:hypothetical protein
MHMQHWGLTNKRDLQLNSRPGTGQLSFDGKDKRCGFSIARLGRDTLLLVNNDSQELFVC